MIPHPNGCPSLDKTVIFRLGAEGKSSISNVAGGLTLVANFESDLFAYSLTQL